jgi:DinB superfamily
VAMLARQGEETAALLASFTPAQAQFRLAPGEWNTIEIVGHLADTERVLVYRALRIARADPKPLEGVDDFAPYVPTAGFDQRPLADVAAEFATVRQASLSLFRTFDPAAWERVGMADGIPVSVRALGYIVGGHELHHLQDIRRYRGTAP